MNIVSVFDGIAGEAGDQTAFQWMSGKVLSTLSYRELLAGSHSLAAQFSEDGIGHSDHVVLMLPLSPILYQTSFALSRIGAICVFIDPAIGKINFDSCIKAINPKGFIGIPIVHYLMGLRSSIRHIPLRYSTKRVLLPGIRLLTKLHHESPLPIVELPSDAIATVTFTGGSSGKPKGVIRTHEQVAAIVEALSYPEAKMQCKTDFPGFAATAFDNLFNKRVMTIPAVSPMRARSKHMPRVLESLLIGNPEMLSGPPAYIEQLALRSIQSGISPNSVRIVFIGGAPVGKRLVKLVNKWVPRAQIGIVYGATEAEPIAGIDATDLPEESVGYCVGKPTPGVSIRIEYSGDTKSGELWATGNHISKSYYNASVEDAARFVEMDGKVWFRTGDFATLDSNQNIILLGRMHHAMTLGTSDSPIPHFVVESAVNELDGVHASALVRIDNDLTILIEQEPNRKVSMEVIGTLLAKHGIANSKFVPQLQRDRRHRSRIDYRTIQQQYSGK